MTRLWCVGPGHFSWFNAIISAAASNHLSKIRSVEEANVALNDAEFSGLIVDKFLLERNQIRRGRVIEPQW